MAHSNLFFEPRWIKHDGVHMHMVCQFDIFKTKTNLIFCSPLFPWKCQNVCWIASSLCFGRCVYWHQPRIPYHVRISIFTAGLRLDGIELVCYYNGTDDRNVGFSNVDMMTSSNRNIFRVTGPLCGCGEFTGQRWIPHINKRLSKQSWGWWFETPSLPLWRHCNVSL